MKTEYEALTLKVCAALNRQQTEVERGPHEEGGNGGYDARRTVAEVIGAQRSSGWTFECAISRSDSMGWIDLHFTRPIDPG